MKLLNLVAGTCLAVAAVGAQAHAHLKASSPKEGAVLTQTPASVSLTFSESARITAISIQKNAEAKQTLSAPTTTGEEIEVKVPVLTAGAYIVRWRAMATDDNHLSSGELHFKVAPSSP